MSKVLIPYTNTQVFNDKDRVRPGGGRFRRARHTMFSLEFEEWLIRTCGPAKLGLWRTEKYTMKQGKPIIINAGNRRQFAGGSIAGVAFEFANPTHAVLFKLTWGGL